MLSTVPYNTDNNCIQDTGKVKRHNGKRLTFDRLFFVIWTQYEVWSKNTVNVYIKKYITVKDTLPLFPLKTIPPRFEHTYPIVLVTFWSSSRSSLSWVSLGALSWLPRCPESIQNVYLSWPFWFCGRGRSHTVPDPVNKVDEQGNIIIISLTCSSRTTCWHFPLSHTIKSLYWSPSVSSILFSVVF